MDQIFGSENFRNEIIVKRGRRKNLQYQFNSIDRCMLLTILFCGIPNWSDTKFRPPLAEYRSKAKWMGFWSNVDRPTMRYNILL